VVGVVLAGGGVFKDGDAVGGIGEGLVEGAGDDLEGGEMEGLDVVLVALLVPDAGDPTVE
jgi:hypothetical protein